MTTPGRDIVVERLEQDLIGPEDASERLADRPSDRYLTGILWPPDTEVPPEEDEQLATNGGASRDESEDNDEGAPLSNTRRPHACGLSFSLRAASATAKLALSVRVRCGVYEPVAPSGEEKAAGRKRPYWQRRAVDVPVPVVFESRVFEQTLDNEGLPGASLYAVVERRGLRADVTLIFQNVHVTEAGAKRSETEPKIFFQVEMRVSAGDGCAIEARAPVADSARRDDDERAAQLIYRDAVDYATGHTCAATWRTAPAGAVEVLTSWIPCAIIPGISPDGGEVFRGLTNRSDGWRPLSSAWLSRAAPVDLQAALELLPQAYDTWLDTEEKRLPGLSAGALREQAGRHLVLARAAAARMRSAIKRLGDDELFREAFQLAQEAMALQAEWGRRLAERKEEKNREQALREGRAPKKSAKRSAATDLVWRPFQLGFQLLAMESALDDGHAERPTMDLLWFPTGGGKTEAYLALVAFVLFGRRLRDKIAGAGVAVLMRYTLRLLTVQQFQRAAALVLACEQLRRRSETDFGAPFSIGLWVGGSSTPNTFDEALEAEHDSEATPKQLKTCPCCGSSISWDPAYGPPRIVATCSGISCELAEKGAALPIWTVDEDVYRERPSLVIGTVDKFAQLARKRAPGALFGLDKKNAPPSLIIQDELHLISGPLGTITALYEVAIDELCVHAGARPKIIGSTATIRRATEQVGALFNRTTFQFPPPIIDANNSGFACVDDTLPGRAYIGISTTGRSPKFTLQAICASLLQSALDKRLSESERDWYWTLVGYFNSLRELGGTLVLMLDDVNQTLRVLSARRRESQRTFDVPTELTSRRRASEIPDILEMLEERHAGEDGACDVLLATNMISVGVDVKRFGLMVVHGQPKSMAEYIQATSRVGRGAVAGLVVSVLNHNRARDRSHFETFRTWHSTIYRGVEAASVTPFAARAQDRALHAVLAILAMHASPELSGTPQLTKKARADVERLAKAIAARVKAIDEGELQNAERRMAELITEWERRGALKYWWHDYDEKSSLLVSAEEKAAQMANASEKSHAWAALNSMRGVEPSVPFRLLERLRAKGGSDAA